MTEESKLLESLVRRQVRFHKALAAAAVKTRIAKYSQLELPGLKPTLAQKEEDAKGKAKP